ncbi:MAG TPA: cyclohexanone monooxygenase [Acidimicrobiaceae bacterium]|nr:cyclohexanone monooxygenase [Acidimicrobiaceae bacterium]
MSNQGNNAAVDYDVVVIGAGFGGMYMLYKLRELGFSARAFEVADDVGGTWYWNRYPGARCDVESVEYSYSFDPQLQQDWVWTERYAAQPEILRYAQHVADRFDLRRDISFTTRVEEAQFDDATATWTVRTGGTDERTVRSRFLVSAVGCLSSANWPNIPGRESFAGDTYHTGQWPHHEVDFTGKVVGVIGTGSSGIQSIPIIARQAEHLYVFQRTPNYTVPAHNRPLTPDELADVKARYDAIREKNRTLSGGFGAQYERGEIGAMEVPDDVRDAEYEKRWQIGGFNLLGGYTDIILSKESNETAAQFVRRKIGEIVHDPAVAAALTPDHVIGCKRLCIDTGYYETFNRPNVTLVDIHDTGIDEITPSGVRAGGTDYALDALVFATGFDAMTGSLLKMDIRGPEVSLREAWAAGPRTYLGLGVHGIPNFFVITGPGSPSVLTNMIMSIEQHVEWIGDCLVAMRDGGHARIEATEPAQDQWVDYVNMVASMTLFPTCNSWYLGANVPGKTRVFMPLPGLPPYREQCDAVAANGYEGFALA